ncbi:hypothetical protein [Virgibacillus ihumii]|uniref:hypothetical protein n=1 Tax=Virgibacillus ihumii TaxID=2686091 RepID=UPI00157DFADE|nr:hypothetical protein [Virgibacillus ihumii]
MDYDKTCHNCGGDAFTEAMDHINLRPMDKKMAIGTEKVYTICLDCGEVVSIKVNDPTKLRD